MTQPDAITKPTPELLRSLTDEHILQALMDVRRLTRAELATHTGLSKPTVSDSVRRLTDAGLVRDTGERTTGRGRVGTYYGLADNLGAALVVDISPAGIVAETVDVHGEVTAREHRDITRPARPAQVEHALRAVVDGVLRNDTVSARVAVISAADPVDRTTGRLVHLPDAPFLVGELSPAELLQETVTGAVTVDTDVHWAARAERRAAPEPLDDFVYLYLGAGLGCAVVSDGEVRRGHAGIAGEIAHIITHGADGQATAFTEVFAQLGLREPDSTAIDTTALLASIDENAASDAKIRAILARAIGDVVSALVAVSDPELVVAGGSWGPAIVPALQTEIERLPRRLPVRGPRATSDPSLHGARHHARHELRAAIQRVNSRRS